MPEQPESPTTLRSYNAPNQFSHRLSGWIIRIALVVVALSLIVEIVLIFKLGGLMLLITIFTAFLLIPLLLQTVLHPEVDILEDGLRLRPLIWQAQTFHWNDITALIDHPLVYNDPATGKLLHGKNYRPREGKVLLVTSNAKLSPLYRLVGLISGAGLSYGFAVSTTTHSDYKQLIKVLKQHLPNPQS